MAPTKQFALLHVIAAIFLFAIGFTAHAGDTVGTYIVQWKVYYLKSVPTPELTSQNLTMNGFKAKSISAGGKMTDVMGVIENGELSINGITLQFKDEKITFDGESIPESTDANAADAMAPAGVQNRVQLVASPTITVAANTTAEAQIKQPFQYFTREADGTFTMNTTPVGCTLSCAVSPDADRGWVKAEWKSSIERVTGRTPIPGVDLDIGGLIINKTNTEQKQCVALGKWSFYAVLQQDQVWLLQLARITLKTGKQP